MTDEAAVKDASARFYAALNTMLAHDSNPMGSAWAQADTVVAMHPIGGRQLGWDEVGSSFAGFGSIATGGHVGIEDQVIHIFGDVAIESGVERGSAALAGQAVTIDGRVTNVYHRSGGAWKLVHHHTDVSPSMVDVLARLQAGQ